MHSILIKVQKYLADVGAGRANPIDRELLFDFSKSNVTNLTQTFGQKPDKFRLRLSNVGRPTCQLQMEAAGVKGEEAPYYSKFRDTYGNLTEALAVLVLKAAGVKVVAEQLQVTLPVAEHRINGTLDLIILNDEGVEEVWDLKSASKWAFNNKFKDFASVVEDDPFGYTAQLVGYAKAVNKPIGGWICICKETGEWTVVPVPPFSDQIIADALVKIEHNVKTITENVPFHRSFSDIEETFRRKKTGNRVLDITCSFCSYKQQCWSGLEYRNSIVSESENPKKFYYTHIDPKHNKETNGEQKEE